MTLPWFKADSDAGYKALTAHAFTESDPAADFLRRAHYAAILATGHEHDDLWTVRGCAAHWKVSRSAAFELMKQVRATMEEGGWVGAKPKSVRTTSGQAADKPRTAGGQAADTAPNDSAHLDAPTGQAADSRRTTSGQAADKPRTRVRGVDPGVLGVSETGDPRQEIGEENTNTSRPAAAGPVCAPSAPLPADPAPGGHPPSGDTAETVPEPPCAPPPPRKPDPVADGTGETPPPIPPWITSANLPRGTDRRALFATLRACIEAVTGAPPGGQCKAAGGPILALWRGVAECPPLDAFLADWRLVVDAARDCEEGLFRNDIRGVRADGARWGTDRHQDVGTLAVQARWFDRLRVARVWDTAGRPRTGEGAATAQPATARASPGRTNGWDVLRQLRQRPRPDEGIVIDVEPHEIVGGPPC